MREETGLPVVTEVVDAARRRRWSPSYADMLQVGTRNMQNFGAAAGGRRVPASRCMLKRGMNATIEEWLMAAEYIAQRGNLDIVLCERGIRTFETATRNTLDISRGAGRAARCRTCRSSSTRRTPAAAATWCVPLSRAAIAVGADGVIVDVHPHPEQALCDGPQALVDGDLDELARVMRELPPLLGKTAAATP